MRVQAKRMLSGGAGGRQKDFGTPKHAPVNDDSPPPYLYVCHRYSSIIAISQPLNVSLSVSVRRVFLCTPTIVARLSLDDAMHIWNVLRFITTNFFFVFTVLCAFVRGK